jgi:predicted aldo/keto reductase-like oxidoreductase
MRDAERSRAGEVGRGGSAGSRAAGATWPGKDRERPSQASSPAAPALPRRDFLRAAGLAAAGAGAALAGCEYKTQLYLLSSAPPPAKDPKTEWQQSRIQSYRPLGKTGFEVSDVSFGTSGLDNPTVVQRAIAKGVNYFDTSPDYSRAGSETALGEGIRGTPRERLFIVSKFCTPEGHLPDDTPVPEVMAAVEGSLKRLGTDYLDLCHVHACNSVDRLMAPNIHEAAERLKEQGKLRFVGVSSHTPRLEEVMRTAVDSGRFDVIMVAYNFDDWPKLPGIFRDAHERGVGVVAMKTLKGARHTALSDFTPSERESFSQAAFKWVLANPDVSGLVVSINSPTQLDEYLWASGQPLHPGDTALLERYDRLIAGDYCRPGCGECLPACPAGLPIDDVLRFAMYYEDYGHQRVAMEEYARLSADRNASLCAGCGAPCQAACPHGLAIGAKMRRADRLLRFA